jgi:hypothetical protein
MHHPLKDQNPEVNPKSVLLNIFPKCLPVPKFQIRYSQLPMPAPEYLLDRANPDPPSLLPLIYTSRPPKNLVKSTNLPKSLPEVSHWIFDPGRIRIKTVSPKK